MKNDINLLKPIEDAFFKKPKNALDMFIGLQKSATIITLIVHTSLDRDSWDNSNSISFDMIP